MRVVIVDDDQLVAISLKTILESDSEIEVVGCGNDGEEAITLYQEHKPEVLLMDIRMQRMSGLDAAEKNNGGRPRSKNFVFNYFFR